MDNIILDRYGLAPVLINHYTAETAFIQKLNALFSRKVTQARDIFDAYLLITSAVVDTFPLLKELDKPEILKIKENILSVDYATFKSQVVSCLCPDDIRLYGFENVWDTMRLKVIEVMKKEQT